MAAKQPGIDLEIKVRRLTISFTKHQYKFVKELANANFEGKFSQALRYLIDKLMDEKLKE